MSKKCHLNVKIMSSQCHLTKLDTENDVVEHLPCRPRWAVFLCLGQIQNHTDRRHDLRCAALAGEDLVHITGVHEKTGAVGDRLFQPQLCLALTQKFRLYAQTKVRVFGVIHQKVPPSVKTG